MRSGEGTVLQLKSLILWLMVWLIPGHYLTQAILCTRFAFSYICKWFQSIGMYINQGGLRRQLINIGNPLVPGHLYLCPI